MLVPFAFTPAQMSDNARGNESSSMIARLRPGATIEQANAQMKAIIDRNAERLPAPRGVLGVERFPRLRGAAARAAGRRHAAPLFVLQAGVLVVLLIACANVASLLLMRATGRARELAIRTTLGAGQWRLVRQLLTEGVVLAALGAAGGLAVGLAGVRGLIALSTRQIPGMAEASLNPAVLAFTTGLALVTGLVFGLVPALAIWRGNTNTLLKEDTARGSSGRGTGLTRATLVIVETALALVLLVGAGLLLKSFARLQEVKPGFSADNVLTAQLALPATRYPDRRRAPRVLDPSGRSGARAVGRDRGRASLRTCRSTAWSAPGRTTSSATSRRRERRSRTAARRLSAAITSARCRSRSSPAACSATPTPPTARSS